MKGAPPTKRSVPPPASQSSSVAVTLTLLPSPLRLVTLPRPALRPLTAALVDILTTPSHPNRFFSLSTMGSADALSLVLDAKDWAKFHEKERKLLQVRINFTLTFVPILILASSSTTLIRIFLNPQ